MDSTEKVKIQITKIGNIGRELFTVMIIPALFFLFLFFLLENRNNHDNNELAKGK